MSTPEQAVDVLADLARSIRVHVQAGAGDPDIAARSVAIAKEIDLALARTEPFSGVNPGQAVRSRILELVALIRALRDDLLEIIGTTLSDEEPAEKVANVNRIAREAMNRMRPWIGF